MEEPGDKKGKSVTSKQGLYSKVAKYADKTVDTLVALLDDANASVRVAAARTLLNKMLPDLKAAEITGADGGPLQLKYIIDLAGGYIPPLGPINATPDTSNAGSAPLQSASVAPEGTQDNNGLN